MDETLGKAASKPVFNYTVLLDDLLELPGHPSPGPRFGAPASLEPRGGKAQFVFPECATAALTEPSEGNPESPLKFGLERPRPRERLRKSDGALPWGGRNKHSALPTFLTDESDSEERLAFEGRGPAPPLETHSSAGGARRAKFSLATCVRDFSAFGRDSFAQRKPALPFAEAPRAGGLRRALGGRHFERVLARLAPFVESGRSFSPIFHTFN